MQDQKELLNVNTNIVPIINSSITKFEVARNDIKFIFDYDDHTNFRGTTDMWEAIIDNILNKKSGLLGISGVSSDFRDINAGIDAGNERCKLAYKMFIKRIIDYIAKYYVELNGCDAIIFTAGIAENSSKMRRDVINGLNILGIKVDLSLIHI